MAPESSCCLPRSPSRLVLHPVTLLEVIESGEEAR